VADNSSVAKASLLVCTSTMRAQSSHFLITIGDRTTNRDQVLLTWPSVSLQLIVSRRCSGQNQGIDIHGSKVVLWRKILMR
jgi:hypothetical protein